MAPAGPPASPAVGVRQTRCLPVRPKLQALQTSLPHLESAHLSTACLSAGPGLGESWLEPLPAVSRGYSLLVPKGACLAGFQSQMFSVLICREQV